MTETEVVDRRGLFEGNPVPIPVGVMVSNAVADTPGRARLVTEEKPEADVTPWRSEFFVTARHSADGNSYAIGDPIPEAEAIRQGVYQPEPGTASTPIAERALCPRCGGRGTDSRRKPRGHTVDCKCPFCGPCRVCGGSRYVVKEEN